MSLVVSDISPLRALDHLGRTDVLEQLYGDVLVPPAVARELLAPVGNLPSIEVDALPFVRVRSPADAARVQRYRLTLDAGESEAIVLALEVGAAAPLIDEAAGRATAAGAGIPHIGVLGILGKAKEAGLIDAVRPPLDKLRRELKCRVGDALYEQFLRSIGEW